MRKIFISYSSRDADFAKQLITALQEVQFLGFMDQADVAVGQPMSQLLRMYIRSASAVVVLLSRNVRTSSWVIFEVGVAQGFGKTIIPILLPGAALEESLPEILRGVQILDARQTTIADLAERIRRAVQQ